MRNELKAVVGGLIVVVSAAAVAYLVRGNDMPLAPGMGYTRDAPP